MDGSRLKTSLDQTGTQEVQSESHAGPPRDDGDSVGAASTDDESDNAWSEASDESDGENMHAERYCDRILLFSF